MLAGDLVQPLVLLAAVAALTQPLGALIARVMSGERTFLEPVLGPVERLVHRCLGEQTMSHLTQMAGLAVQNFLSAGVGLAVAVALIRGLVRRRPTPSATSGPT
jgi:K+-transporting ATPase A subunit